MALDLRGMSSFPTTTLLTINNATVIEIKLPVEAKKISLSSEAGAIKVYLCDGLLDAGVPAGTDGYQFCAVDNILEITLTNGTKRRNSVFVMFKTTVSDTLNILTEGF